MPVELTIVESVTELSTTVVEVVLESASAPGPAGPTGATGATGAQGLQGDPGPQGDPGQGVPVGGATGEVLAKASNADYDTTWSAAAGGGAPTDVDYLVGTASGSLSAEIVVGTSPGGELGGTWASPTVDATHSGSSHAAVQAAAEATAAAALSAHLTDATDAHDASAISSVAAGNLVATDVQAALNELDTEKAAAASAVMDGDAAGGVLSGTYPNPGFAADMATQAELDAHITDSSAAHAASAISADSTTLVGTGTDVQAVLEELDNGIADHLADATAAHAASAVSVDSTTLSGTGTDVQASLEELDNLLDDHSARHENGGADEISVAGLSGELADAQPVTVRKNTGADVGTRSRLNFIEGTNVTLTVTDDGASDEVDITITSSGGSTAADDESLILHMEVFA